TRDSIDKSNPIQNSDDVPDAATASPSKTDVGDADKDDYKFECNCYYFLLAFYISLNGQTRDSIDKSNPIQNSDDVPDAATASPSKTDVGDADKDDYKFE
ncbi:hypothetical protein RYX36_008202, partial [Vicia faba]